MFSQPYKLGQLNASASPNNRKGMANATFFSFFDLGVGLGAMTFGQLAFLYGYNVIYITSAGSVMLSIMLYIYLLMKTKKSI